ncbi:hypothetical protein B0T16DRAFT_393287 [Cercophora newfieldiana]|uniref:Uncharacterized protein n=1 Tax=Cercophora newfieldiana TaxID=92897 RepID=A0AA39XW57_9PEZI|nr:hypothetical protein B0T16DRAFT_393287 [Cercophora newfieldiana]
MAGGGPKEPEYDSTPRPEPLRSDWDVGDGYDPDPAVAFMSRHGQLACESHGCLLSGTARGEQIKHQAVCASTRARKRPEAPAASAADDQWIRQVNVTPPMARKVHTPFDLRTIKPEAATLMHPISSYRGCLPLHHGPSSAPPDASTAQLPGLPTPGQGLEQAVTPKLQATDASHLALFTLPTLALTRRLYRSCPNIRGDGSGDGRVDYALL